eukprot:TRINITY_DN711_c0_g1_i1.p1 TRINITY_DN711_c0_g1~~TRINITY_DN711_c0_g1_i1.p1  ORF type:complete len:731 (-),score=147.27 TRINITY_DN711_c0_g1_i1:258-2450(-)
MAFISSDAEIVSLGLSCGIFGLIFAAILAKLVLAEDTGNEKMREISEAISVGAAAFLRREYKYVSIFVVFVFAVLIPLTDIETAVCFLVGATVSALTGFIGMSIAVRANVRTTAAAEIGLNPALRVAFRSGSVMGFSVVGLGIVTLSILYLIFPDTNQLAGFGMGASSIALFARVGGGIYTKAADVGSDLVGKVEAGIPEDDPRNPGVIADNVGDNVGDVAGMGADLFESYVGSIIAAAAIGVDKADLATDDEDANSNEYLLVALPFWICGVGIIASFIGSQFVRTKEHATQNDLLFAMRLGVVVSSVLIIGGAALIVDRFELDFEVYACIVIGLVAGILIGFFTEYCTSFAYWPTISIAEAGRTGPATVVIQGLAVGMWSCVPPVAIIFATILSCDALYGDYGVAIAPVGMLSTLGVTLATDAYGPVADNAGGIAEMAERPKEVRERTDALDALGNTTAATGKGFAIGSAVLTAIALMKAYTKEAELAAVDLVDDVNVIAGLLVGAVLPFLFASLTMTAVGKAAQKIIAEVRRQFREIPGLKEGRPGAKADYARCVDISTSSALHQMIIPGVLAVVSPVIIGFGFGPEALAGLLIGSIVAGFLLAVTMANAGGAWDNAKKYCESGQFGGKGSETHKALVAGDTVGDPFKDTSGPALNILLKLMSIVALVLAKQFDGSEEQQGAAVGIFLGTGVFCLAIYKFILLKDEIDFTAEVAAGSSGAGYQQQVDE